MSKPANGERFRVLVIDDDRYHAEIVAESLQKVGYDCTIATSGVEGSRFLDSDEWDVILTDLKMADFDGLAVLRKARETQPDAEVVMITGYGDVKTAVEAIKQGAANYLTKPIDIDELRRQLDEKFGFAGVIGNSAAMQDVLRRLRQVAPTDASVLLLGETGTGKDLVAHAIHNNSPRRNKPFAPLNCAAPNPNLIEDELFGHERGGFTNAVTQRKGIFEYANGGTVFLDEIGDMPFDLQAKLLHVLERREVTRIGSNEPVRFNTRVISATHRDLEKRIADNQFRSDLYYRLKVVTIRLPALRERREDIPLLGAHFIKEFNAAHGKNVTTIAEPVRRAMQTYDWPGNVRELRNFLESMVVLDHDGVLGLDDVQDEKVIRGGTAPGAAAGPATLVGRPLAEVERYYTEQALLLAKGNREEAARMLGIGERTLYRNIQAWKVQDKITQALAEHGNDVEAAAKALDMDPAEVQKKMARAGADG